MESWSYFNNRSSQGTSSLQDIIQGYIAAKIFHRKTWVKKPQDVYWSALEYTLDIVRRLPWDYIHNQQVYYKIQGDTLIKLYQQRVINKKTQVKLSSEYDWIKFQESVLFTEAEYKTPTYEFHGMTCKIPGKKEYIAGFFDFWLFTVAPLFVLALLSLFCSEDMQLVLISLWFVAEILVPFLSSFLEACWISFFGSTLGGLLVGLYVVTSRGKKLSFPRAYVRQLALNSANRAKRCWKIRSVESRYPFGAAKWDREHGYILTEMSPKRLKKMQSV